MLKSRLAKIAAAASVLALVAASIPAQAAGNRFILPPGGHGGMHGMGPRGGMGGQHMGMAFPRGNGQRNFAVGGNNGNWAGNHQRWAGNHRNGWGWGGAAVAGGLALGALAANGYYGGYDNGYVDDSYALAQEPAYVTSDDQVDDNGLTCTWVKGWHQHVYGWYQRCY